MIALPPRFSFGLVMVTGLGLLLAGTPAKSAETGAVDFNRDVRPILSENCFKCHGFDEQARKARLRLDQRNAATQPAKSGAVAIVPDHPDQSELVKRISSTDPDDLMPPADSGKSLKPAQIETLRRWIAAGADYARHWAFESPKQAPLPAVSRPDWPRNEIDHFVLARLDAQGLKPSREADKATLLRRVAFDLTGFPPTVEELDAFLHDERANAFECVVDRLLQSPHFGERMAVDWLDAARFADTNGYFGDKTRQMWLWRDWVIHAFNRNLPFDQFTIEQLAGDLLPDATIDQKIATGFNRNTMANNESGIIDEEYRTEYVVDRLDATAATWMGITLGCAQCHDHKYDPITQKEFYRLFAFFNNMPESGLIKKENPPPLIEVPSAEQRRQLAECAGATRAAGKAFQPFEESLHAKISAWEKELPQELPERMRQNVILHEAFDDGLAGATRQIGTTIAYEPGILGHAAKFDATQHAEAATTLDPDRPWTISLWLNADGSLSCPLSKIEATGNRRGIELIWQKGHLQINLVHQWGVNALELATTDAMPGKRWQHIAIGYDGSGRASGVQVFVNGLPAVTQILRDSLNGTLANEEPLRIGRRDSGLGFYGLLDELRIVQHNITAPEANEWFWAERLRGIIAIAPAKRSAADQELLLDYFVDHVAGNEAREARHRVKAAIQARLNLQTSIPTALVMQEMAAPRQTTVLVRGQYDKPGDKVEPGVPAALSSWPPDAPRNRLGFARWLVSPENPLTARVFVNRLWQQCFGEALVRTMNDFGSQGEAPTHPELLDWLAVRFMQSGWNVKEMLKLIVMSGSYRQSSSGSRELLRNDPENRWLARGPRFRLSGEMLRDQALVVSGLLVARVGGPSVKPYQPPGLWESVSYNGEETYVPDKGADLWRRSLYTFLKRQAPPPALLTFDGPTREKCVVRRARTNTPLQALVLLNDETYVEAARALANLTLTTCRADDDAGLSSMFRRVTSRKPGAAELNTLRPLLGRQRARFTGDHEAASKLLAIGDYKHAPGLDPVELAAWTIVAQTILNLDEVITRR